MSPDFGNGAITAAFAYAAQTCAGGGCSSEDRPNDPVIFVGGAGDSTSQIVSSYEQQYALDNPTLVVKYFSWEQESDIINYIQGLDPTAPVTLIGHSWGADTAAEVALALPGRVDLLITIDPVSLFSPSYLKVAMSVNTWIDVNSAGGSWTERSNIIAGVGGAWGSGPSGFASAYIPVNAIHANFSGMMQAVCSSPMIIAAGC